MTNKPDAYLDGEHARTQEFLRARNANSPLVDEAKQILQDALQGLDHITAPALRCARAIHDRLPADDPKVIATAKLIDQETDIVCMTARSEAWYAVHDAIYAHLRDSVDAKQQLFDENKVNGTGLAVEAIKHAGAAIRESVPISEYRKLRAQFDDAILAFAETVKSLRGQRDKLVDENHSAELSYDELLRERDAYKQTLKDVNDQACSNAACAAEKLVETREELERVTGVAGLLRLDKSRMFGLLEDVVSLCRQLPELGYVHRDSQQPISFAPDGAVEAASNFIKEIKGEA